MNDSILRSIAEKQENPVYVYDAEKIQQQYNRLQNAFKGVEKLQVIMLVKHFLIFLF